MLKTILVATDGSDHAKKAVILAADLAANYATRLIVLTVYGERLYQPELMELAASERIAASPELVLDLAKRVTKSATAHARTEGAKTIVPLVREGDPADEILTTAEAEGADMIVMGSHGFGPLRGLLLGSVSHKVTNHAQCTCVTVR